MYSSRMLAFPRSASIIALNTAASEQAQQYNLDINDKSNEPGHADGSSTLNDLSTHPPLHQSQLDPNHHGTYTNP